MVRTVSSIDPPMIAPSCAGDLSEPDHCFRTVPTNKNRKARV